MVEARLKAEPNDAHGAFLMSLIKSTFGDQPAAIALAQKAVTAEEHNAEFHAQLAQMCAYMAEKPPMTKQYGYIRQMKRELAATYAIDPNQNDALLVEMMFAWKAPFLAGGDKKKARNIADRLVSINPNWGYLAQARLAQDTQDDIAAERALVQGTQVLPQNYKMRSLLATFYCCVSKNKRYDLAEKWAREAIKLDPGRATAYVVLAHVYAAQERYPDLESTLLLADRNVPDDPAPYYAAGRELLEHGKDLHRAEIYLRKYASLEPEGREPTTAEARWSLGLVLEKEGRPSDAATELQSAIQIQPDFEVARKDLKRVRGM